MRTGDGDLRNLQIEFVSATWPLDPAPDGPDFVSSRCGENVDDERDACSTLDGRATVSMLGCADGTGITG